MILVCWGVLYESVLALPPHFSFCLGLDFLLACWFGGVLGLIWFFFFPLFASRGWGWLLAGCGVSFVWLLLETVVNVSIS